MKRTSGLAFSLIAVFLIWSGTANAATTHYLPRQFDPSEMGTIGMAVVNPTTTAASLTFRLQRADGSIAAITTRSVPAKGQLPLTLAQLFPEAQGAGWMSVDSDVDQVSGFWMGGDFVNSTDGAPLLSTANAIANPAFTFFGSTTEISLVNVGSVAVTANLNLRNAGGTRVASRSISIPASGLFQDSVAALFPIDVSDFDTQGYWISVSPSDTAARLVGTSITPVSGRDNIVVNAAYVSYTDFVFPQVVGGAIGGTNYTTVLTLTNYRTTAQTVSLTLKQASGAAVTIEKTIPASGVLRSTLRGLCVRFGGKHSWRTRAIAEGGIYSQRGNEDGIFARRCGLANSIAIVGWWICFRQVRQQRPIVRGRVVLPA